MVSEFIERLMAPVPRKCEWVMRDYEDGTSEGPFDPLRLEAASEITRLTAELSALRATAEKLDKMDGMDGAACALIRQKLDEFGAPRAAFIDDHVANGIVHAKRLALEEAAKVAEGTAHEGLHGSMWESKFKSIAASIRALMVKP